MTLRGVGMNLHLIAWLVPFFVPFRSSFFPRVVWKFVQSLVIFVGHGGNHAGISQPLLLSFAPLQVLMYDPGLADALGSSGFRRGHAVTHMPTANAVAPEILEFLVGVTDCCGAVM